MKFRSNPLSKTVAVTGGLFLMVSSAFSQVIGYNSIPNPLPPNMPSLGFQATATKSLGDRITLSTGTFRTLNGMTVAMSSWACETGSWNAGTCASTPNATFSHDITLNIYDAAGTALLGTRTQSFDIPYRPSADPSCTGGDAGKWQASNGTCYNGFAFKIEFNMRSLGITLPDTFTYSVAYNTSSYGTTPLGVTGGYDSLNVGLYETPSGGPTIGTDPNPDMVFWNGAFDSGWAPYGVMALVSVVGVPTLADQCKKNQWMNLHRPNGSLFKNQGDCVSFTQTGT